MSMRFSIIRPLAIGMMVVLLSGCGMKNLWNSFFGNDALLPAQKLTIDTGEEKIELTVEIADEESERTRGLMRRDSLGEKRGMWFVFEDSAPRSFWMWQMKFPIDILYVNSALEIRDIVENVPPCPEGDEDSAVRCETYPSSEPVQYVLEVPAGFVQEYGVAVGDKILLE